MWGQGNKGRGRLSIIRYVGHSQGGCGVRGIRVEVVSPIIPSVGHSQGGCGVRGIRAEVVSL